jgi:hypothetical protein
MKRLIILRLGVELIVGVGILLVIPVSRAVLAGYLHHERFHDLRPMSYWIAELHHPDPEHRTAAISKLGEMGPAASDAIPALVAVAREKDLLVRNWAIVEGLGGIGPSAIRALDELRQDRSMRTVVVCALGRMGRNDKDAIHVLCDMLDDPSEWTQKNVVSSLAKLGVQPKAACGGQPRAEDSEAKAGASEGQ